jgi:hypothetical protein
VGGRARVRRAQLSRYDEAQQIACEFLAKPAAIDETYGTELQALLERCWRDREATKLCGSDRTFEPLEIKLAGGEIRTGVAPAAEVRERQTLIGTLLMRVAEWLGQRPFRVRGEASRDISRNLRIYEAPARAASYGLRLYVASGTQPHLPKLSEVTPRTVVDTFLDIAAAAQMSDEELERLVPQPQYRTAFLAGFRDLAPDGTKVGSVTFEHPVWNASRPRTVYQPHHREEMTRRLTPIAAEGVTRSAEGILKVVNLKAKTPSIEIVTSNSGTTRIHIDVESFEDSVREKLNKFVKVTFEERKRPRSKVIELHALDISLAQYPWENAARSAVKLALDEAVWDEEEGSLFLLMKDARGEPSPIGVSSVEELRSQLEDIASLAWQSSIPRDAGEPVFGPDADEIVDIVNDLLDEHAAQIAAYEWQ